MSQSSSFSNMKPPPHHESDNHHASNHLEYIRVIAAAVAILVVWLNLLSPLNTQILGVTALMFCGYPILREAFSALLKKRMTMELSMTIALGAALAIGEVFTALVIVMFVLIAEALEHATVQRGRRSISSLVDLLPNQVLVRRDGEFVELHVNEIVAGDVVLVKPGGRIVADGAVLSGNSYVDESTITGESFPAEKKTGSTVFAGSINQSGALEITVERIGADTAFGKIVHAVEEADKTKANVQRLSDRMAGWLVLFAIGAAVVTFAVTRNIHETISVIIVCGACGIAAGTPLAIVGSIGRAARRGSIIKGGLYLERLGLVDTIAFDKTGTLTYGAPQVVSVEPAEGQTHQSLVSIAASAEGMSEHPLAKAILQRADLLGVDVSPSRNFSYVPGRGIRCDVDLGEVVVGNRALMDEMSISGLPPESLKLVHASEVLVALAGKFVGRLLIADRVRTEAKEAVQALKKLGIRTLLLSGDAQPIAEAVATKLGIDECAGNLRPEDKQAYIRRIQSNGRHAAMVGDGVNDAPALIEASVGIAIGSGTDVALESADVVLIGSDLMRLVEAVRIARRCRRVIWCNFAGTLLVDGVGIALAFCGLLNPLMAAFIHVGSEIAFMFNSARLYPFFVERSEKKK